MNHSLSGKVIFITGAARGIGAATAREVVRRGAQVALVGMEPDLLAQLRHELGPNHLSIECDVTDSVALTRAVSETEKNLGGIDAVVANAGISNVGTVAGSPVDALLRTIDVNLSGVIRTAHATLPALERRRGYLLLVSSAAAFAGMPGMAAYGASKAGVRHFGDALRFENKHKGIGVGVAHMAWIDTDLVRDLMKDLPSVRDFIERLPGPAGAHVSAEECASRFADAICQRKRLVYVPEGLRWAAFLAPFFAPILDRLVEREAAQSVEKLEKEVRALGRSFGKNSIGLKNARP